jgi:TolB-like protein
LLILLLEQAGEVVTREELRQRLWPADTFVDFDNSLNAAMGKVRQALSDSAVNPRFIETVPRRGYRFLLQVEQVRPERSVRPEPTPELEAPPPARHPKRRSRRPWIFSAAIVLLAVIALASTPVGSRLISKFRANPSFGPIQSLAVLPLRNLSSDPQQNYFADGMTEALITDLARLPAIRVISRTSSMQYRDSPKLGRDIARELNVDALVEGSVQRSGSKVRVTVQLIDGRTDRHIWAQNFDADMTDVLVLQNNTRWL